MAVAALVVGICAVPLFWVFGIVPVAAIVLGGIALSRTGREGRPGRGHALAGTVLGVVSLIAFVVVVIVARASDDDDESGPARPADRGDTVTAPRATSDVSLEQVFAPISGYTYEDAPESVREEIRREFATIPGAADLIVDTGVKAVKQGARTVAYAVAVVFDDFVAGSDLAAERFVAGAKEDLATTEEVTLAGQPAVFGTDEDGQQGFVVYKNGVGLVVIRDTATRATLETVTTRLLDNIP